MKTSGAEVGVLIESGKFRMRRPWGTATYATLAAGATRGLELINPDLQTRGILPDPFDLPNYAGNFSMTFVFSIVALSAMQNEGKAVTQEEFNRQRRIRAAFIGVAAVGANAVAELVGYGPMSTPDPFDFIYGVAAAAMVYRGMKPEFLTEDDIEGWKKQLKIQKRGGGITSENAARLTKLQDFSKNIKKRKRELRH